MASTQKGKLDPQSAIGVWLGKSLMSDEHLIGTDQGIRRCRSIWRRPEKKRWEKKTFEGFRGLPWQPRGELTVVPGTPSLPAPGTPGGGRRGVYITLGMQEKHGQTPGCPGCFTTHDQPKPHSKECRQRFEEIVAKERQQSAGGPAAGDGSAGGPATLEPAGGPGHHRRPMPTWMLRYADQPHRQGRRGMEGIGSLTLPRKEQSKTPNEEKSEKQQPKQMT